MDIGIKIYEEENRTIVVFEHTEKGSKEMIGGLLTSIMTNNNEIEKVQVPELITAKQETPVKPNVSTVFKYKELTLSEGLSKLGTEVLASAYVEMKNDRLSYQDKKIFSNYVKDELLFIESEYEDLSSIKEFMKYFNYSDEHDESKTRQTYRALVDEIIKKAL